VTWPASRGGRPCDTIETAFGSDAAPMDSWQMFRLLTGLAGLTGALARLHGRQTAHRALEPPAIIVRDDGSCVLRDLGLAAREYEPGEGPAGYQAPEQQHGARGHPGPGTDVYQLAAVAYRLITGHPPHARSPLPLASQGRDIPERVSRTVDAALAGKIADRPGIREFGDMLRSARNDLS
jgi:serine/threonine protein kinase